MYLIERELCDTKMSVMACCCWDNVACLDNIWFKEVSELNLLIEINKLKVVVLIILLSLTANGLDFVVEFQVMIGLGLHFRCLILLVPYHFLSAVHIVIVDELVA